MEKKRRGINIEGLTKEGLTSDGTYFKDEIELVPAFGMLPSRPRYLVLSDGQVLDRANPPKADLTLWPGNKIEALRRCTGQMKPLMGEGEVSKRLKAKFDMR